MASDVTISIFDRAFFYTNYGFSWQAIIAQTLRGSVAKTSTATETVYTDRFSGLEITVQTAGAAVTGLTVTGPVPVGGVMTDQVLVGATFAAGAVTKTELLNAFNSYSATGGTSNKLANLLDSLSFDVTAVDTGFDAGVDPLVPVLFGGSKDDIFRLNNPVNLVFASGGNDTYIGNVGADLVQYTMQGRGLKMVKSGTDRLIEKADGTTDTLKGIEGIHGTEGADNFRIGLGGVNAYLHGAGGKDVLGGGNKADLLDGGEGDDTLLGRGGDDLLIGGNGNDFLDGSTGNDILIGGSGYGAAFSQERDELRGGGGRDLFVIETTQFPAFASVFTVIKDFVDGTDFIGLIGSAFDLSGFGQPDNMIFKDLSFRDTAAGAVIAHNGVDVALVENVLAADLTRRDFVEMVDLNQLSTQFAFENDTFVYYF